MNHKCANDIIKKVQLNSDGGTDIIHYLSMVGNRVKPTRVPGVGGGEGGIPGTDAIRGLCRGSCLDRR